MPVCIRAIDTTIFCFRSKGGAATGALIEDHSGVGRYLFLADKPAPRTGDDRVQFQGVCHVDLSFSIRYSSVLLFYRPNQVIVTLKVTVTWYNLHFRCKVCTLLIRNPQG